MRMSENFIKTNPRQITKEDCNGILPIKYLYSDEQGHDYWAFKCPQSNCQNFFTAREDNVRTGHVSSCGCLRIEKARELGQQNKKENRIYHHIGCNYVKVFFNNEKGKNHFFITDIDNEILKNYSCYAHTSNNRIEPYCLLENNKSSALSRVMMETPSNLQVDHTNRNPLDARTLNMRNCTDEQNKHNHKFGKSAVRFNKTVGKYCIAYRPAIEFFKDVYWEAEEEAWRALNDWANREYGEFSPENSELIAEKIDTHEFDLELGEVIICGNGILKKISELPQTHIANIELHNIITDERTGRITEEQAGDRL